jgi:hypothetical protein
MVRPPTMRVVGCVVLSDGIRMCLMLMYNVFPNWERIFVPVYGLCRPLAHVVWLFVCLCVFWHCMPNPPRFMTPTPKHARMWSLLLFAVIWSLRYDAGSVTRHEDASATFNSAHFSPNFPLCRILYSHMKLMHVY